MRCHKPLSFRMVTVMIVLQIREPLIEPMPQPHQHVRLSQLAAHSPQQAPQADPQRVGRSLFWPPGVWSVPYPNIPYSAFRLHNPSSNDITPSSYNKSQRDGSDHYTDVHQ